MLSRVLSYKSCYFAFVKIAVVILNWNGKTLLERYLPSVVNYSKEATIYVADNASTDDSVIFIEEHYPQVTIIKNKSNGGYAKGYNDALNELQEEIFVLLNSDVAVTPNWLESMITLFKTTTATVAAQPKIMDDKKRDFFEYAGAAGGYIDYYGYPFCRGRIFDTLEKDRAQYNDNTSIFWASGACLFVRRDAFRAIGGFDEDYFTHQEEIDLCWRLQANGGNIKYVSTSIIYHLGGATLTTANPRKTFYNFRNSLLMLVKNVSGNRVFFIVIARMILDGIAAIRFLTQMKPLHFFAVFKAHISFYSLLPKYINKRSKTPKLQQYASVKSIVWQYFVKGNRLFSKIVNK